VAACRRWGGLRAPLSADATSAPGDARPGASPPSPALPRCRPKPRLGRPKDGMTGSTRCSATIAATALSRP
jgi:hypothetical protein